MSKLSDAIAQNKPIKEIESLVKTATADELSAALVLTTNCYYRLNNKDAKAETTSNSQPANNQQYYVAVIKMLIMHGAIMTYAMDIPYKHTTDQPVDTAKIAKEYLNLAENLIALHTKKTNSLQAREIKPSEATPVISTIESYLYSVCYDLAQFYTLYKLDPHIINSGFNSLLQTADVILQDSLQKNIAIPFTSLAIPAKNENFQTIIAFADIFFVQGEFLLTSKQPESAAAYFCFALRICQTILLQRDKYPKETQRHLDALEITLHNYRTKILQIKSPYKALKDLQAEITVALGDEAAKKAIATYALESKTTTIVTRGPASAPATTLKQVSSYSTTAHAHNSTETKDEKKSDTQADSDKPKHSFAFDLAKKLADDTRYQTRYPTLDNLAKAFAENSSPQGALALARTLIDAHKKNEFVCIYLLMRLVAKFPKLYLEDKLQVEVVAILNKITLEEDIRIFFTDFAKWRVNKFKATPDYNANYPEMWILAFMGFSSYTKESNREAAQRKKAEKGGKSFFDQVNETVRQTNVNERIKRFNIFYQSLLEEMANLCLLSLATLQNSYDEIAVLSSEQAIPLKPIEHKNTITEASMLSLRPKVVIKAVRPSCEVKDIEAFLVAQTDRTNHPEEKVRFEAYINLSRVFLDEKLINPSNPIAAYAFVRKLQKFTLTAEQREIVILELQAILTVFNARKSEMLNAQELAKNVQEDLNNHKLVLEKSRVVASAEAHLEADVVEPVAALKCYTSAIAKFIAENPLDLPFISQCWRNIMPICQIYPPSPRFPSSGFADVLQAAELISANAAFFAHFFQDSIPKFSQPLEQKRDTKDEAHIKARKSRETEQLFAPLLFPVDILCEQANYWLNKPCSSQNQRVDADKVTNKYFSQALAVCEKLLDHIATLENKDLQTELINLLNSRLTTIKQTKRNHVFTFTRQIQDLMCYPADLKRYQNEMDALVKIKPSDKAAHAEAQKSLFIALNETRGLKSATNLVKLLVADFHVTSSLVATALLTAVPVYERHATGPCPTFSERVEFPQQLYAAMIFATKFPNLPEKELVRIFNQTTLKGSTLDFISAFKKWCANLPKVFNPEKIKADVLIQLYFTLNKEQPFHTELTRAMNIRHKSNKPRNLHRLDELPSQEKLAKYNNNYIFVWQAEYSASLYFINKGKAYLVPYSDKTKSHEAISKKVGTKQSIQVTADEMAPLLISLPSEIVIDIETEAARLASICHGESKEAKRDAALSVAALTAASLPQALGTDKGKDKDEKTLVSIKNGTEFELQSLKNA